MGYYKQLLLESEGSARSGSEANNILLDPNDAYDTDDIQALEDHLGQYYWLLYPRMFNKLRAKRTYEAPLLNQYLVCTPLKGKDNKNFIHVLQRKFRKLGYERIVITREIMSKETGQPVFPHYNVLITSKHDYSNLHDSVWSPLCHVNHQYCPTIQDYIQVLKYIFRESQRRAFKLNKDYTYYLKE